MEKPNETDLRRQIQQTLKLDGITTAYAFGSSDAGEKLDNSHASYTLPILNEKAQLYGDPSINLDAAARLMSVVLGHPISAHDVAILMCCLKLARIITGKFHDDNYVDLEGFAEIARILGDTK